MGEKEFEKEFNKLTYSHEVSIVFNDFLDYVIDMFTINPDTKLFNCKGYKDKEYEYFYNMFRELVLWTQEELEHKPFFDGLGTFYEDIVQSKYKAGTTGQFFTPMDVTRLMTRLVDDEEDPVEDVKCVYDCACGSSRTLLSHHAQRPYDLCFGWDLDSTSVKMSVINFLLHGVKGSVCHMNSLSLEFFTGFKVNEFIDLGKPFTVYQCRDLRESQVFIGHNTKQDVVTVKEEERPVVVNAMDKTKQTTLI